MTKEKKLELISRIVLFFIIFISIIVGIFVQFANSTVYLILNILTAMIILFYIIMKLKNKDLKINMFLMLTVLLIFLRTYFRTEKEILYSTSLIIILLSYYAISVANVSDKLLNYISLIISSAIIPTVIINGIFNSNIIAGTSFSGRLNPFMYFPYLVIALVYNEKNKAITIFIKFEIILLFIDILWSESRAALMALVFFSVMYILFNKKDHNILNSRKKAILKILLLGLIIIQIIFPRIYILLFKNYAVQLNTISYNWTGKYFFSGRQRVWERMNDVLEGNKKWGTGDVQYKKQLQAPHNEFMNLYYCWGIFVALSIYVYLYSIGRRCIEKSRTKIDLIIILSFLSTIICTIFETYIYAIHFYIFNNLLVAYLLNKKIEGEKIDEQIS